MEGFSVLNDYDRAQIRQPKTLYSIAQSYIEDNLLNPRLQLSEVLFDKRFAVVLIRRSAKSYIRSGAYSYKARMSNFLCLPEVAQSIIYHTLRSDQLYRLFDPPIRKINKFKKFEEELHQVYQATEQRIKAKLQKFEPKPAVENGPVNLELVVNGEIKTPIFYGQKDQNEEQGDFEPVKPSKDSALIEIAVTEDEYQKIQEMRQQREKQQQLEKEQKLKLQRIEQRKKEQMLKKNHQVFSNTKKKK